MTAPSDAILAPIDTPAAAAESSSAAARAAWLARATDWCLEGSLYLLLLLLPFSKAVIEITSVFLLVGWALQRLLPTTRRDTSWLELSWRPLAIAMGLFLAACAASIPLSTNPAISAEALVSKWAQYLVLLMVAADVARRPGVSKRAILVIAVSAAMVAFDGLWQERHRGSFFRPDHRYDFFYRMTGPYENPIDLATYLMVVIPLLVTTALSSARRGRWLFGGLAAVLMYCLARTSAVGAWLGLCVGLVVLMAGNRAIRRWGLALLAVNVILWGGYLVTSRSLHDVLSPSEIGKTDRIAMWTSALGMIRERPIVGQGLNTFMANYLRFWVGGEKQPRYAHNCYLQAAAETGLIGLAAFVGLLGQLFALLIARVRRAGPRAGPLLGLLAGLAAFAAQAGIDTNFYALRQAALFWTMAGLAVGMTVAPPDSSATSRS